MTIRISEFARRFGASERGLTTIELSILTAAVGLVLLIAVSTLSAEVTAKVGGKFVPSHGPGTSADGHTTG